MPGLPLGGGGLFGRRPRSSGGQQRRFGAGGFLALGEAHSAGDGRQAKKSGSCSGGAPSLTPGSPRTNVFCTGASSLSLLSRWGRACARGRGLRLRTHAGPWPSGDPARALAALGSRLQPAGAAVTGQLAHSLQSRGKLPPK